MIGINIQDSLVVDPLQVHLVVHLEFVTTSDILESYSFQGKNIV